MKIAIEKSYEPINKKFLYRAYKYNFLFKLGDRTLSWIATNFDINELERIVIEMYTRKDVKPTLIKIIEI